MQFRVEIYFVLDPIKNQVKIGKSRDALTRISAISRERGVKVQPLLLALGQDTERLLHQYFSSDCVGGEWFGYSDRIKEVIRLSEEAGYLVLPDEKDIEHLAIESPKTWTKRYDTLFATASKIQKQRDDLRDKYITIMGYKKAAEMLLAPYESKGVQEVKKALKEPLIPTVTILGAGVLSAFGVIPLVAQFDGLLWGKLVVLLLAGAMSCLTYNNFDAVKRMSKKKSNTENKMVLSVVGAVTAVIAILSWGVVFYSYIFD